MQSVTHKEAIVKAIATNSYVKLVTMLALASVGAVFFGWAGRYI